MIGGVMAGPILMPSVFGVLILSTLYGGPAATSVPEHAADAHATLHHSLLKFPYTIAQMIAYAFLVVHMAQHAFFGAPAADDDANVSLTEDVLQRVRTVFRYLKLLVLIGFTIVGIALASFILARTIGLWGAHTRGVFMNASNTSAAIWVYFSLISCAVIYAGTRLSLLVCNRALGGRASWRAGWRSTRGHFWSICCTHFVTILPALAAVLVGAVVVGLATHGRLTNLSFLLVAVVDVVGSMIVVSLGATCGAWLYRRYAGEAGEELVIHR